MAQIAQCDGLAKPVLQLAMEDEGLPHVLDGLLVTALHVCDDG